MAVAMAPIETADCGGSKDGSSPHASVEMTRNNGEARGEIRVFKFRVLSFMAKWCGPVPPTVVSTRAATQVTRIASATKSA
jgi:hypothetical protein